MIPHGAKTRRVLNDLFLPFVLCFIGRLAAVVGVVEAPWTVAAAAAGTASVMRVHAVRAGATVTATVVTELHPLVIAAAAVAAAGSALLLTSTKPRDAARPSCTSGIDKMVHPVVL